MITSCGLVLLFGGGLDLGLVLAVQFVLLILVLFAWILVCCLIFDVAFNLFYFDLWVELVGWFDLAIARYLLIYFGLRIVLFWWLVRWFGVPGLLNAFGGLVAACLV